VEKCSIVCIEEHERGIDRDGKRERKIITIREAMPNQQKMLNNYDLLHVFRDLLARQVSSQFDWPFL
jgi:hypothetical protein